MMEKLYFFNDEWEEEITCYYDEKSIYTDVKSFCNAIRVIGESIQIDIIPEQVYESLPSDININDLIDKVIKSKDDILRWVCLEDNWNYKIYFIETEMYYIIYIWETSA